MIRSIGVGRGWFIPGRDDTHGPCTKKLENLKGPLNKALQCRTPCDVSTHVQTRSNVKEDLPPVSM